ncbi:MAG TPA: hypothetical protein VEZ55_14150, partial [Chitinophagaceae bacterium]|nr:hypothetical protein [Chitinophagaceae bacterium]
RGNAALYVLPDGTTMLFDAGEIPPTDPRVFTPRNAGIKPDSSRKPYEWIVHYIRQVAPGKQKAVIDYALISHFHDDHFGAWYPSAPVSSSGKYVLTGITGVADMITVKNLVDRGHPNYTYPYDMKLHAARYAGGELEFEKTMDNYFAFLAVQQQRGMKTASLQVGERNQLKMLYDANSFPTFHVQPVKCNGKIWSGRGTEIFEHFAGYDSADSRTWPDENSLSLALTFQYGDFTYYTGGDNPGNIFYGDAAWRDVETPIAKAIGEVDVATMDHHGNRDAVNEFMVRTLKPRIWIGQSWSADHPGHEVLIRMTTPHLYAGPRDLFSTNMLAANKHVIGGLIDRAYKSQQGHVLVRVLPGGKQYYVIILDDNQPELKVREVFGPYTSKHKLDPENLDK